MGGFAVTGTDLYPTIIFNPRENIFHIHGISTPENGKDFYQPVITWMEAYSIRPNTDTDLHIDLEYFNLSSSKALLFLFYMLNEMHANGHKVKVTWCYRDAYILSAGRDYAFMVKIPFEFRKVSSKEHTPRELSA
jgi:hypothetical protein